MSSSPVSIMDQSALRKKLQDIHDYERVSFDWESVIRLSKSIMVHVTSETDHVTQNGPDNLDLEDSYKIPDTLRSLLQKISCVFTCKCSGGDSEASAMEILKLLSSYEWQAKVAIVVASFVVEYAQFRHVVTLYKSDRVGMLVATLKQLTFDNADGILEEINSSFKSIVTASIEVTEVIAKFSDFSPKHISNDVTAWRCASDQIPIAGHSVTTAVIACVARLTRILHQTEISLCAENHGIFVENITSAMIELQKHYEDCRIHVEEKKDNKYMEKLRLKFHITARHKDNRKILQTIFNSKDGVLPLALGSNETEKSIGVDAFQGKKVLLLISDLNISGDEISILADAYNESRRNQKLNYEIVWFPIGDDKEYEKWEGEMPWYKLKNLSSVKRTVRYVKEEWKFSKKPILVALDEYGKVGHLNALNMALTWGNDAYPFTCAHESDFWSCQKWGLDLLIGRKDPQISQWIKEKKITILYGGDDNDWVRKFVAEVKKVESRAKIEVGMMYVGTDKSEEIEGILTGKSQRLAFESSTYFTKRIESMVQFSNAGAANESIISVELRKVYRASQSEKGWVVISHVEGTMAVGEGGVMLQALKDYGEWENHLLQYNNNFVAALNHHLSGLPPTIAPHACKCTECGNSLII